MVQWDSSSSPGWFIDLQSDNQGNRYIWPNTVIYWPALTGEGWGWEPPQDHFQILRYVTAARSPLLLAPKPHPSKPELHLRFRVIPRNSQTPKSSYWSSSNVLSIIYCILYTWFKRGHSWTLLHSETIGIHLACSPDFILAYNIGAPNTRIAFTFIYFPWGTDKHCGIKHKLRSMSSSPKCLTN